ncbi:MAG: PCI domain-containing protein [Nostocaceae cyanobacterium]|nr:PCI domain-containing protein [Nostocaceae cyanobacterium]
MDTPESQNALIFALVHISLIELNEKKLVEARDKLDRAGKILDTLDAVEKHIHAAYYRANAEYYKETLEFAPYYTNALLYLACIELSTLSTGEKQNLAYSISTAALLADSIFNFGELLQHPILDVLDGTDLEWLKNFLFAMNSGNIAKFESLHSHLPEHPLLEQHKASLREKIHLAALVEAIFKRPPHERVLSFEVISTETQIPKEQVEFLAMKALSLKLVKGHIDQVDERISITWVQPRVLDKSQISVMRQRLVEWSERVQSLEKFVETNGQDIWATV